MSLFDYKQSILLGKGDPSFSALIMAAMRKADTHNSNMLQQAFPEIHLELRQRYDSPGGLLEGEPAEYADGVNKSVEAWDEAYHRGGCDA